MRETRIIEFKETITNTFLKTVSAFSNYNGGEIYFGIDDNGNVKGIADVKQSCLDIENKINDSISPQPDYTLEIQNDSTIKLTVKSGIHKPYLYKSKAYKRNDTATIEVDTLEFSRLILEGKNIRFEELPYNEQKLTFEVLHQKLKESIQIETFNKDTLKILNLYDDNNGYNNAAVILGAVDFSSLEGTSIIAFPQLLPFKPEFNINAIISVTLIFLVSATETIGDTSALAAAGLNREATLKETSGSIACDGFISALSSVFGCLPITSFSQNVGLVAMTKVVNRYAIGAGAVIMILAGIFPFFGSLLATLPDAVLGGCTLMMFGNIVISGLQMIGKCGFSQRNITIAALSLSIGIGFTQVPEIFDIFPQIVKTVFAENCVAVVFLVAILLNLVLPKNMEAAPAASDDSADA